MYKSSTDKKRVCNTGADTGIHKKTCQASEPASLVPAVLPFRASSFERPQVIHIEQALRLAFDPKGPSYCYGGVLPQMGVSENKGTVF